MRKFVPVVAFAAVLFLVYLAYQQSSARSLERSYALGDNRRASISQLTRMPARQECCASVRLT